MTQDLTLKTQLTADAGPLNVALRQAGGEVQKYGETAQQASAAAAAAARDNAQATTSQTGAVTALSNAQASAAANSRAVAAAHTQATAAVQRHRAETAQLTQAYRQLPMQITDVVTSISSGMPVWMVAIQQGGQIRDSFGGAVPALRAMAGAVTPVTAALGGLAVAAGASGIAYMQAEAEAMAYVRAIVMSGNASGVTFGMLDQVARRLDATITTQGDAAGVLAALTETGRVGAENMVLLTTATVRARQSLGVESDEMVRMFEELGKRPVEASAKLNEQFNYLTITQYRQIRALKEQNRETEAAALAQKIWAETVVERARQVDESLGSLERAWRAVKLGAADAWDAMLGLGRRKTPQQELADLESQLANIQISPEEGSGAAEREAARLYELIAAKREQIAAETEVARMQGRAATANREQIAKEQEQEKAAKAAADAYKQLSEDIRRGTELARAELEVGRQLSGAERERINTLQQIDAAQSRIGDAAAERLRQAAQERFYVQKAGEDRDAEIKRLKDLDRARQEAAEKATETASREAAAAVERNQALGWEIQTMGLTGQALADLELLRIDEDIAKKEALLDTYRSAEAYTAEAWAIKDTVDALRRRRELVQAKADVRADLDAQQARERARREEEDADRRRRDGIADSIADGILRGSLRGKTFSEILVREMEEQFKRAVLQPVIRPIVDATQRGVELFLNYLTGSLGASGGGYGSMGSSGVINGGSVVPGFTRPGEGFHRGGVVGSDAPTFVRALPAAVWAAAPRFHRGMLAADEYPAILQRGESVLTPGQMRQVAGLGQQRTSVQVPITVINQSGTPVQAEARERPDGGIELLLTAMEERIAGRIDGGAGPVPRAIAGRFGLRTALSS